MMGRFGGATRSSVVGLLLTTLVLAGRANVFAGDAKSGVTDSWLVQHAYTGADGALAVRSDQRQLAVGDSILVFRAGRPVERRRIARMVSPDSANAVQERLGFNELVADTSLWNLYGGARELSSRADPPSSIAWFAPPPPGDPHAAGAGSLPFALVDWPAPTIALGGDSRALSARSVTRLISGLAGAVPAEFLRPSALKRGRSYRGASGDEIVELILGVLVRQPPRHGATLRSVRERRIYLVNGSLRGSESLARKTGEEEHVDVDPPRLNERNWWDVPEQVIGFVSRDGGVSWDRISLDVGFEGVLWRVARVVPGMPEQWSDYLYTYH